VTGNDRPIREVALKILPAPDPLVGAGQERADDRRVVGARD